MAKITINFYNFLQTLNDWTSILYRNTKSVFIEHNYY